MKESHLTRAIQLYRSIVRERGTIGDQRDLSQALLDAVEEGRFPPEEERQFLEECRSIREPLLEQLGLYVDQAFLGKVYAALSRLQEDPEQQKALMEQAHQYGYVYMGQVYSEVLEVLRHMEAEHVDKLPKELILYLYDRCDLEYDYRMTKSLSESPLRDETLNILRIFNDGFWKTDLSALNEKKALRYLHK